MYIIKPITVSDTMLISTNISEWDEEVWSEFVSYSIGDLAILPAAHKVYESLTGDETTPNLGNVPAILTNGVWVVDETNWVEVRATTPWLAFDGKMGDTQYIEQENTITYTIKPGVLIDSIVIFNAVGISVTVELTGDAGAPTYNVEKNLVASTTTVTDWYSYYGFSAGSAPVPITELIFSNLPTSTKGSWVITVEGGGNVRLGEIVLGTTVDLGITQYTPSFSIIDYSIKTTDSFGNYTIVPRAFSKRMDIRTVVMTGDINNVANTLIKLRTTPVVWVASSESNYTSLLVIYGYYRDFDMIIPHKYWSEMNIQIEGLT